MRPSRASVKWLTLVRATTQRTGTLKQRHPHSEVTVKDLKSGEVTVAARKAERPPA
jgi:hypothetical protein